MKFDFDFRSIKYKVWVYFVIFAAVLMIILWLLQILFLNKYYASMKTTETERVAASISSLYVQKNSLEFQTEVRTLAAKNDVYIHIESSDGKTTIFSPYSDASQEVTPHYRYVEEMRTTKAKLLDSGKKNIKMELPGKSTTDKTLVYASFLTAHDKDKIVLYIFTPLYLVQSTVKILQNQLIYVTIISLAMAFFLAFYLSNRITKPIRSITKSAQKLAQGQYGVTFNGGSYTEISNLAETLTKASLELEKTDILQKDLIANVSHDLRTPLTMVKSYAEMIRDLSGDIPEKRNAHLQVIIDEADRLSSLVSDMLTISRMQSGALTLDRSVFDLRETVEGIINSFKLLMEENGYRIRLLCRDDRIMINGDADKIKQVFSNLIGNAIKFCGEDKAVIVTIKRRNRWVVCQVIDHGIGIPSDELSHIWERYYKASSNMARETKGTGLGLSIVKEILALHNSKYGVESQLGKGTTFWFQLPLYKSKTHYESGEES